jgi:hypothetical protein
MFSYLPEEIQVMVYQFLGCTKLFQPYGIGSDGVYCELRAQRTVGKLLKEDPEFSDITYAQYNSRRVALRLSTKFFMCRQLYSMAMDRDFEFKASTFFWYLRWRANGPSMFDVPEFPEGS